jgi:hypothetical protein
MSTSLKRLLDAEAARSDVPPAPVHAVVAGGQARVRRWRIIALADDQPIERPEEPGWTQLDGPWTDLRSIHFGTATVSRPPGWNVEVLTSTRDSALYTSSNNGGRTYRLYELRPDESVSQIGSDVEGAPLADPMGSYVAWQDKSSGEIVVYDTSRHAEVARQPVERHLGLVNAVDGDTIFYSDASQTYAWRPAQGIQSRSTCLYRLGASSPTSKTTCGWSPPPPVRRTSSTEQTVVSSPLQVRRWVSSIQAVTIWRSQGSPQLGWTSSGGPSAASTRHRTPT